MDKIKDPAMLLSIVNSAALVGTTAYFYKQMEAMRADMLKITQTLSGVVRKLTEIEKTDQHKNESLHALNDQIKSINGALENMPSPDVINNLDQDLEEIIEVMEDNNITIERPSQNTKPYRNNDRRSRSRRDNEYDEKKDHNRKQGNRSGDSRNLSRVSSRDSTRDSFRESRVEPVRDSIRINRLEPAEPIKEPVRINKGDLLGLSVDDDVNDLIGAVRQQERR